jgi:hypothetical protein
MMDLELDAKSNFDSLSMLSGSGTCWLLDSSSLPFFFFFRRIFKGKQSFSEKLRCVAESGSELNISNWRVELTQLPLIMPTGFSYP